MDAPQVRVFQLNKGENKKYSVHRLEKGWVLRFLQGPSLHSVSVRLFCNHPVTAGTPFDRSTYRELQWQHPTKMSSDLTDIFAEVNMIHAGAFNYYFTTNERSDPSKADGQGHFMVDPTLSVGLKESQLLPLDSLCIQTVITKLLGPFNQWESRLAVARETGYNMIHFTPVQELGVSNSAYCIRDHHRLSYAYSDDKRLIYLMIPHMLELVQKMGEEWGMLSITDLVLNHTAVDSPLLQRHPECAYNMDNSPYLRPAYIIDRILHYFSLEVAAGKWEHMGLPARISHGGHLEAMRKILHDQVFPRYRISEFFLCDLDTLFTDFMQAIDENRSTVSDTEELTLIPDPQFRRKKTAVDLDVALKLYNFSESSHPGRGGDYMNCSPCRNVDECWEQLKMHVAILNQRKEEEVREHLHATINNFVQNAYYRFLDPYGCRLGRVSPENPIMWNYFVMPDHHEGSVETAEYAMDRDPELVMAVSGWVMGTPTRHTIAKDISGPDSNIYLRRELIPWGDNVRLRYGKKPSDCPALWEYMRIYAERTAQVFHGIRLDNLHSTPIHVAEYMLEAARQQRPDLYVLGELFTGDENLDSLYVSRLGINALVRESLKAVSPQQTTVMVAKFSGAPLGSFTQPRVRPLLHSSPRPLFCDQTHDNETPMTVHSVYDLWPRAAVVAMTNCAIASTVGYDHLVPHHIDVVGENRLLPTWARTASDDNVWSGASVYWSSGIIRGKLLLNRLHAQLALEGFSQVHVEMLHPDVVEIVRHNPLTHQSVIVVAATAFQPSHNTHHFIDCKPVCLQGKVEEILFEGGLVKVMDEAFQGDDSVVKGLTNYSLKLQEHVPLASSQYCCQTASSNKDSIMISFKNFIPGTVVALRCSLTDEAQKALIKIEQSLSQFGHMLSAYSGQTNQDKSWEKSAFRKIVQQLTLCDLNRVLYRVEQEEKDDGFGFSTYHIPGSRNLCYSGLRGVMSALGEVRPTNDLQHPLSDNLRDGNWLMDYIVARLKVVGNTKPLGEWFEAVFSNIQKLPRPLVPSQFDAVITGAYVVLREMALQQLSRFVRQGSTFVQALALGCTQFLGYVRSAKLPPLSPCLQPKPRTEFNTVTGEEEEAPVSLASGLPHFSAGHWRCWGRDTFIALRGMMLVTGRYSDARCLILAFAGTLRHGLIPNLLWEGRKARYNCRDAVWWWLQAIKDYCLMAPDGENILQDPVWRLYPTDDAESTGQGYCEQPLHAVMQEALARHMAGLTFRERGAGPELDVFMRDEGFSVEIGVSWPKGYVYGGSVHNCGTWMDVMGKSETAGTFGRPATPRDGSAVELVGLCASAVSWLAELSAAKIYPYSSVMYSTKDYKDILITFEEWSQNIRDNFEKDFFISKEMDSTDEPRPHMIVRRGMYKDCLNATQKWADYQLRPNFCVAMVVAPELFDENNAWTALNLVQEVLVGPLGMKTLDPNDWAYVGDYWVSQPTTDARTAAGFNYHNGPEFVWLLAYFLRAKLQFAVKLEKQLAGVLKETVEYVDSVLCRHYSELMNSPWKSLPELTNTDGAYCADSCRAQAVSNGSILEVLYDVERLGRAPRPSIVNFHGPLVCEDCKFA